MTSWPGDRYMPARRWLWLARVSPANAAHHLTEAGLDVVVVEASDRVGGRIQTDEVDGFLLDRGFQLYNRPTRTGRVSSIMKRSNCVPSSRARCSAPGRTRGWSTRAAPPARLFAISGPRWA